MKKLSLATILVLSTVGTALFAQAETVQENVAFQADSRPMKQTANNPQWKLQRSGGKQWSVHCPHHQFERQPMDGRGMGMKQGRGQGCAWADCPYAADGQFGLGYGAHAGYGRQMGGSFINGGFMLSQNPSKVADVATWLDDQTVILEGKIIKQVGRKEFVFQDNSGELTLEIVGRAWHGQTVTPNDQVKIVAGVEKSWGKTEVFGLYVEKISSTATNSSSAN